MARCRSRSSWSRLPSARRCKSELPGQDLTTTGFLAMRHSSASPGPPMSNTRRSWQELDQLDPLFGGPLLGEPDGGGRDGDVDHTLLLQGLRPGVHPSDLRSFQEPQGPLRETLREVSDDQLIFDLHPKGRASARAATHPSSARSGRSTGPLRG